MNRSATFVGLIALAAGCASAPITTSSGFSPQITPRDLQARLTAFAHDSMMGRAVGSVWNVKATDYMAAEFQRLGLKPAGDKGGWFQVLPYQTVTPDTSSHIETASAVLVMGRDFVSLTPTAAARPLDGARAVYGGLLGDSEAALSAEQASRAIVVLQAPPGMDARRLQGVLRTAATNPRFADAALIAISIPQAPLPASPAVSTLDTTPNTRLVPQIAITSAAAAALLGKSTAGANIGATGSPVRGRIGFVWRRAANPSRNVVAIIPGTDPALRGEYVSITAHNDHIGFNRTPVDHDSLRAFNIVVRPMGADSRSRPDTGTEPARIRRMIDSLRRLHPARPDSIFNGADDDGSGSMALIELAEAFMGGTARPHRSILFVSHTAEETGLVGSQWFTDHPTVPLDSIVAEIDLDMIGRGAAQDIKGGGPTYLEVVGLRRLSKEFGDWFEAVNAKQRVPFVFNYEYDAPGHPLRYYCRADHYSYARYGIPSVSLSRGGHMDYHQITDESQYIDYPDYARLVQLVFDASLAVANADHAPRLDAPRPTNPHVPCRQ